MFSPPPSYSTEYRILASTATKADELISTSGPDSPRSSYIWSTFWDVFWADAWSEGLSQEWGANLARRFCSSNSTEPILGIRIFAVQTPIVLAKSISRPTLVKKIGQASCPNQL